MSEDLSLRNKPEESLDPEDWEGMKKLGHRMVNDMVEYLRTVRERPVWIEPPTNIQLLHLAEGAVCSPRGQRQPPDQARRL